MRRGTSWHLCVTTSTATLPSTTWGKVCRGRSNRAAPSRFGALLPIRTIRRLPRHLRFPGKNLINAGQMIQFHSTESFHLLATAPVSVAQFMVGSDYPGPSGGCGADFSESFPPQAASDRTNCDIPLDDL